MMLTGRWILGAFLMTFGVLTIFAGAFFALGSIGGIGLAAFMIGLLLTYLSSQTAVSTELLKAYGISSAANLERFLREFAPEGKATYLGIKDRLDPLMVLLPLTENSSPNPDEFRNDDRVFILDSEQRGRAGILLEAPGIPLLTLLEKESGVNFFEVGREELLETLRSGMVDSLNAVADLKGSFIEKGLKLEMRDESLEDLSVSFNRIAPITAAQLGCPICSTAICAFVKSARKDVRLEEVIHESGRHLLTLSFS